MSFKLWKGERDFFFFNMEKPSNICENKHTTKNPQGDIYLTQQVKQNSNQLELSVKKDPLKKDEKNKGGKWRCSPKKKCYWYDFINIQNVK